MNQVKESLSEETKVINSVQEDLTKTAEQMQENMLEDLGGPRKKVDADGLLDMESATERPWERDAADEPEAEKEEEESTTDDDPAEIEDEFSDDLATETSCNGTTQKKSAL